MNNQVREVHQIELFFLIEVVINYWIFYLKSRVHTPHEDEIQTAINKKIETKGTLFLLELLLIIH